MSDTDIKLCERLIAAYRAALDGRPDPNPAEGMWSLIYETRQRRLAEILEARDAPALAAELAAMFRSKFVVGMAPGSLVDNARSSLGDRLWRVKALDGLVSLAEALGVVPVQDAEQGWKTRGLDCGATVLAERVEAALGFSIDFPDVGAAHGVAVGGRLLPIDAAEQIYSAVRMMGALRMHLAPEPAGAPRIVEIGGGYGAMAHWFLRGAVVPSRYTIVDLPIAGVLQGYFLSGALGESEVSFFGEKAARVVLLPNTELARVEAPYDVLVNKDSMPEMATDAALEYLSWARSCCSGIFLSCNQESARGSLGEEQGLVPFLVGRAGGFERLTRDQSWVRRGYVEEVYAPADVRATTA